MHLALLGILLLVIHLDAKSRPAARCLLAQQPVQQPVQQDAQLCLCLCLRALTA